MSTPAERMYPSMTPTAPVIVEQPTAQPMYPNSPELVDRQPAAQEQADAPANPVSDNHHETVKSPDAPADPAKPAALTQEALDAAIPADIKAERASRADANRRMYSQSYSELMGESTPGSDVALLSQEAVQMAFDHNLSRDDFQTALTATRKFGTAAPDEATLGKWKALTTDQDLADAQRALDRDPRVGHMLAALNIIQHPSIVRMLARSGARRR